MVLIFAPYNTDQASRKISSRGLVFELIKPFMIPLSETLEGFFIDEDYQNNLTIFQTHFRFCQAIRLSSITFQINTCLGNTEQMFHRYVFTVGCNNRQEETIVW